MHVKPITAIVVLLLVVVSLSVSGCTTSETTQTPSAVTTSSVVTQSFLQTFLAAYMNETHTNDALSSVYAFNNSTSAHLERAVLNRSVNRTMNYNETFIEFPTSQNATNYLNAMNTTAYGLVSTVYENGRAYQNATGQAPQIYKDYVWVEGDVSNSSEYKLHEIQQLDHLIVITTATIVG